MQKCIYNNFTKINFKKSKFNMTVCVHKFWPISVLSLMPKGEIVGIKLQFPLVTTLIHISDSIKLKTQFPTITENSRVNQVTIVYTEQNRGYQVNIGNVKTSNVYRASQCLPRFIVSTEQLVSVMETQCHLSIEEVVFIE